jgi:hypothetical protein
VIIDNGSGMNIVSLDAVKKLKLSTEKHPNPYKVSWVDDTTIPMKQRCLVNFSLGKNYREIVWCDVIPMRACHILLGRPWLFDRKVQYDGYKNTYTFLYEGKRLVLKPIKVQEFAQPIGELNSTETQVLTLRKFTETCKERGLFIALISHLEAAQNTHCPLHHDIQALLQEFKAIMPEEL